MTDREVELLAVGAGPSNLAIAAALEELAPDLADNSLLVERAESVRWQPGLLLPWVRSQVSCLKDLVTRRNPRSRFSFLNYLHSADRLDDFINMGNLTPFRAEISDYLSWVARSLARVEVRLGCACTSIEPRRDSSGALVGWLARLADGDTVTSRYLVVGAGREAYVPPVFAGLSADRVIHSTQYSGRIGSLSKELPYRIAVVGGAQSAAEMFKALSDDLPNADLAWLMRSIGLSAYEHSKFTNELFYPGFVDRFHEALPEARQRILREMHRTNYSGLAPGLLETLYQDVYLERLANGDRRHLITMVDITGAWEADGEVVLELTDWRTGEIRQIRRDLVFLGTGFRREPPALVRGLADALGVDRVEVTRQYRMVLAEPSDAACYLQGINEASHGIADSLLSVVADRAADTVRDLITSRSCTNRAAANGHATATVGLSLGLPASNGDEVAP
jgi:L-ornithine N5-monooxygenase